MSVDTAGTYKSRRGGLIFFGLVELAMGVLCLLVVYCVVVFPQLDYNAVGKAMQMPMPPGMPDLASIYRSPWFLGWLAILWLGYFGYFVFVRRYFTRTAEVVRG